MTGSNFIHILYLSFSLYIEQRSFLMLTDINLQQNNIAREFKYYSDNVAHMFLPNNYDHNVIYLTNIYYIETYINFLRKNNFIDTDDYIKNIFKFIYLYKQFHDNENNNKYKNKLLTIFIPIIVLITLHIYFYQIIMIIM